MSATSKNINTDIFLISFFNTVCLIWIKIELTIVNHYYNRSYYLCKCTCGNEKIIRGKDLKYNKIKSCGCLNKEKTTERNNKHSLRHTRI